MLADSREFVAVEKDGDLQEERWPENGAVFCANHYVNIPEALLLPRPDDFMTNSTARFARMTNRFSGDPSRLDVDFMRETLMSHGQG